MFFRLLTRVTVASLVIVFCIIIDMGVLSLPINNGFSIKFNPISVKEDRVPKTTSALFAKIPQELSSQAAQAVFSEKVFPRSVDLATGCTNQIARILFPVQDGYNELNDSAIRNRISYINVPVLKQSGSDYKILVVSAPYNIKLRKDEAKPMLVYIVFPMDDSNDSVNIPSIYFVRKSDGKLDIQSREKVDPILIIDNNRTVTGLKSKEVSKFVKFKNKFSNRLKVEKNNL